MYGWMIYLALIRFPKGAVAMRQKLEWAGKPTIVTTLW